MFTRLYNRNNYLILERFYRPTRELLTHPFFPPATAHLRSHYTDLPILDISIN